MTGLLRCFCPSQLQCGDRNPLSDLFFFPQLETPGAPRRCPSHLPCYSPPWPFLPYAKPRPAPLLLPPCPPRPVSVVTSPGRHRSCRSLQPTRPRTPDTAAVAAILEVGTHADGGDVPGSVTPSGAGPRLPSRTGCCAASSRERPETRSRRLRSGYSG